MAKNSTFTSGFGEKFTNDPKPIINDDGSFNVTKIGSRPRTLYQHLVSYSWPKFLLISLCFYLLINIVFAFCYLFMGVENLSGIPRGSVFTDFLYCFFFSIQTFTTVGYGSISPIGIGANIISTVEAMGGLMGFALITGLLYGRFSRPNTRIRFSKNVLIVPNENLNELHFQLVNEREDVLIHPHVQVIVKLNVKTEDGIARRFYELPLRVSKIVFFPLNWRVVHEIDSDSPFFNLSQNELLEQEVELLVLVNAFDNVFRQNVYTWHEFMASDFISNARFNSAYQTDDRGQTILNLDDIDNYQKV